jgi:hypothetical protein
MSDVFIDLNVDKGIVIHSKKFLDSCTLNVLKMVRQYNERENIRGIGSRLFYKNYFERTQMKMFLYKLHENKMKKYAEDNMKLFGETAKENIEEARKETKNFLSKTIKLTLSNYKTYIRKVEEKAIFVQARWKGYLVRLIYKMELMNVKLNLENERMVKKARERSKSKLEMQKRKSTK